ncbi:MAG TPA: 3-hydroxyacyl-ACP dehydratase FabZ [Dongiaceae bacterium]|jgi:3-hydroxyacyl-[acyl-carrier-protein] dehydratase
MSETQAPSGTALIVDSVRIMQMIPHRPPFLMIDQVRDLRAGEGAVGIKNVTMTEPHFQGHFPGAPVMPGVLIVEAMAQTAAVLVVHTLGPEAEGKIVYFMSVDNCRFRRPVFPGDQIIIEVNKQRQRGPVWRFEGIAKVDGKIVAEAVFAAMFRDHR